MVRREVFHRTNKGLSSWYVGRSFTEPIRALVCGRYREVFHRPNKGLSLWYVERPFTEPKKALVCGT